MPDTLHTHFTQAHTCALTRVCTRAHTHVHRLDIVELSASDEDNLTPEQAVHAKEVIKWV